MTGVIMGIIERREREKEQRRNNILDAAEEIFFSKGFSTATMDEVAEIAELSKGTLYLYFKSKEELYYGIASRALSLLRQMFQKAVDRQKTGIEKVRAIGEAYYEYSQKYLNYFNMIIHYEMSQMDKIIPEGILLQCHQLGRQVMGVVAAAVAQGIQDGSMRRDLNPLRTAYLLQGLSTGIIQLIAREKGHIDQSEDFQAKDLMADFMDMMFHAMQSDEIKKGK
jgi:AcrR family transcriptional regulator